MIDPRQLLAEVRSNPLVSGLNVFRTRQQLASALTREPVDMDAMRCIPHEERILLPLPPEAVVSNSLIRIHFAQQQMLVQGYNDRDPRKPENLSLIQDLAQYVSDKTELSALPWREHHCGGCLVEGITGTGKSFAIDSYYSQLKPVLVHPNMGECAILRQLVYLRVHMSADGSRGGFIMGILDCMDKALGTKYAERYCARSWTVERLLVVVLYLFSVHRLGVLIVEEAQQGNLVTKFGREFLTFFLRLLNYGIPVVLIGNPLAFTLIDQFTQDAARFSVYGRFRLDPVESPEARTWAADWLPGLWRPRLTTRPDEAFELGGEPLEYFLWRLTGGFPRSLARLRLESEKIALMQSTESVNLSHVLAAYVGPEMSGVLDLSQAFATKDHKALKSKLDVDWAYYLARWTTTAAAQSTTQTSSKEPVQPAGRPGERECDLSPDDDSISPTCARPFAATAIPRTPRTKTTRRSKNTGATSAKEVMSKDAGKAGRQNAREKVAHEAIGAMKAVFDKTRTV
jgi:hypothetical protein